MGSAWGVLEYIKCLDHAQRSRQVHSLPEDLSNLEIYKGFLDRYAAIIKETLDHLKEQHFDCFVVGSYRDPSTRELHALAADTCMSFPAKGAKMFNKAILETAIGSAAARASRNFCPRRLEDFNDR